MFDINVYARIQITDSIEFLVTETMIVTWIIMGILLAFALVVRIKSRKWDALKKPSGLQNVMEMLIEMWEGFYLGSSTKKMLYLAPWFFSLIAFLILSNIIGIVGLRNPTADWGMTFPLAMSTFFLIHFAGVRHRAKSYLRGIFLEPNIVLMPLNVIGELARPISLSFRLFGNLVGGMILMSLLYTTPIFLTILIPVPLHMYFDLAAGVLQAVIFSVLSITFVGIAAEE